MRGFIRFSYCILFLLLIGSTIYAQDPHFSQFYANRVFLNPAYAGLNPDWHLTLQSRLQWPGIPYGAEGGTEFFSSNYNTHSATLETQLPCMIPVDGFNLGAALTFFRDAAGDAPLTTNGIGLALSYERPLWENNSANARLKWLDIRFGAQASTMWKKLNGGAFIYSDQLDPVGGLNGFEPSILELNSGGYANLSTGLMLRGHHKRSERNGSQFTLGLSLANINNPQESLREGLDTFKVRMRWTIHGGVTFKIRTDDARKSLYLAPQFRWDHQPKYGLNMQTIGLYGYTRFLYLGFFVQYNFPNADSSIPPDESVGIFGRDTKMLLIHLGLRTGRFSLGLSYDLRLSGLKKSQGAYEISIGYRFGDGQQSDCYQLGRADMYDGDCPVNIRF